MNFISHLISKQPIKNDTLSHNETNETRTQPISLNSLAELSLALTLNLVLAPYRITLLQALFSAAIIATMALKILKVLFLKNQDILESFQKDLARLSFANLVRLSGIGPFFHECGHYLAYLTFYENAQPRMQIPFFGKAITRSNVSDLSFFGSLLGKRNVSILTIAAGGISSTVTSITAFGLSRILEKKHPKVSKALHYYGIIQALSECAPILETYSSRSKPFGHDYDVLWKSFGIPPYVPLVAIVGSLALQRLYFIYRNSTDKRAPT